MELQIALGNALGEATLVLFTTLAPAGIVAYLVMAGFAVFACPFGSKGRYRVRKYLIIPLVLTVSGLVASATHLGNPSNALYVLTRVGVSPLSNEVVSAVVFLAFASVFWALTFALRGSEPLDRVFFAMLVLSGAAFLLFLSLAYHVQTIVTWNLPQFVIAQWGCAFAAGPLVALVGFAAARHRFESGKQGSSLLWVSAAGALVAAVSLLSAWMALQGLGNSVVSAVDLVPHYLFALVLFVACAAAGIIVEARDLHRNEAPALTSSIAVAAVVLLGIFVMRFGFYMLHMTVGVAF